jgi:dynein intermediate chain
MIQEHVVYSKEIQTSEGSFDVPQLSEEEIRQQIMDELEIKEKQKQAQLEEERLRAEQEKTEEYQGKVTGMTGHAHVRWTGLIDEPLL